MRGGGPGVEHLLEIAVFVGSNHVMPRRWVQEISSPSSAEATFIATEGVAIGILVAFIGTYGLVLNDTGFMEGFTWAVPWTDVLVVGGLTLAAAALTAAVPSRQAGRIRPAQALRTLD